MTGTRGILVSILFIFWPFLNVVDSTEEFNAYFNLPSKSQCDIPLLVQSESCPLTNSTCQHALDITSQCQYNETLERIESLFAYTQSEIANINARAKSLKVNMEKSLEDLASRNKRSTSHVKELFETFATAHGKMAGLRAEEMSPKEQETRQDDLVFLNAFFEDVNETMCEVLSRLDAVESQIISLQAETDSNSAFIAVLSADLASLESLVNQASADILTLQQEMDSVEADIANVTARVDDLEAKVQELCDQVESNTMHIAELFNITDIIPDIFENITHIEERINDLAQQFNDSLEDVANLNETLVSAQEDIDDLSDGVTELWDKVNDLCDRQNITEEQFDIFESIIGNLTDELGNLTETVNSILENQVLGEDLLALEENINDELEALNSTLGELADNVTMIMSEHDEIMSNIDDLLASNETTQALLDVLSDNLTSVSDLYDDLADEVDLLNETQGEILDSLEELNATITACCNASMPEPLMCCNQTENTNTTDLENRIEALESENEDLLQFIELVNVTLMEKISQLENCCSLIPANLSLEFPFPFPLDPPHNGSNEGCGYQGSGGCHEGCGCEEGESCGCAGRICALEKKIDRLLKKMPDCPDGYTAIYLDMDQKDFVCVRIESTVASQSEQGKTCLRDGLLLAEFPCVFGFQEFKQYTQEQGGAETLYFVGASDEILDGYWTWIDSAVPVNEAYWAPGEPNGGDAENCAVFNTTSGLLQDEDCTASYAALCMTGSG